MTTGIGRSIAQPLNAVVDAEMTLPGAREILAEEEQAVARVLLRVAADGDRALLAFADP